MFITLDTGVVTLITIQLAKLNKVIYLVCLFDTYFKRQLYNFNNPLLQACHVIDVLDTSLITPFGGFGLNT